MMKNTKFLFIALAGLMISSCAGETEKEVVETTTVKEESCLYSYSGETTEMSFTAYKFLGKTGVGGTFTEINISGDENEDPIKVIESLDFKIPVSSVSTKDDSRDAKIEEFFFGTINTQTLSGEVVALDVEKKTAIVKMSFNDVSNEVEGKYSLEDGMFEFKTEINVLDWDASAGIERLNDECKDLHTDFANGDDESKLWPDVSLSFSTKLKKVCN